VRDARGANRLDVEVQVVGVQGGVDVAQVAAESDPRDAATPCRGHLCGERAALRGEPGQATAGDTRCGGMVARICSRMPGSGTPTSIILV
jgi:hypothetical protein